MRIEDLMKLVNAGFTKDEILAIVGTSETDPEPSPAPAPAPEPATAPAPEPATAPAPAPAPEHNNYGDAITQLTAQVSQLTTLVQKSNLLRMEQPDIKPETAEDVIASIIFPTFKGDNK